MIRFQSILVLLVAMSVDGAECSEKKVIPPGADAGTWEVLRGVALAQISDVSVIDEKRMWTAFGDGSLLKTENSGKTWESVDLPSSVPSGIISIQLLKRADETCYGWALTRSGMILHTRDGTSWSMQEPPTKPAKQARCLHVLDEMHAWVAGDGFTWQTVDGGKSWNAVRTAKHAHADFFDDSNSLDALHFIFFEDTNHGVGFGAAQIGWVKYRTQDGGKTWMAAPNTTNLYASGSLVEFRMNNSVRLYAGTELLYKHGTFSIDEPAITALLERKEVASGHKIEFLTRKYSVSLSGAIAAKEHIHRNGAVTANLDVSTDLGRTWKMRFYSSTFQRLCFVDTKHGWLVGAGGRIARTRDGGNNWIHSFLPTDADINTVFFLDRHVGWLSAGFFSHGLYGKPGQTQSTVWKTVDGGQTWKEIYQLINGIKGEHISGETVYDITFTSENEGWAVTHGYLSKRLRQDLPHSGYGPEYGRVLHTTNGGDTWQEVYLGSPLARIMYNRGRFIAWGSSQIFLSDDGKRWERTASLGEGLRIAPLDRNMMFAVGYHGTSSKSADGGKTWAAQKVALFKNDQSFARLEAITFCDSRKGWCFGPHTNTNSGQPVYDDGVFFTEDQGETWKPQHVDWRDQSATRQAHWSDAAALDEHHVWAVGNYMIRLKDKKSIEQ